MFYRVPRLVFMKISFQNIPLRSLKWKRSHVQNVYFLSVSFRLQIYCGKKGVCRGGGRLRIHMSNFSYSHKMWCPLNLVLENWAVIVDADLKLPKLCHASEMTRSTLNHWLKFPLCFISCHICYGKIEVKNFIMAIKVKLLVSKASDRCFKGSDFL